MTEGVRIVSPGVTSVMKQRNHKPAQSIPQPLSVQMQGGGKGHSVEIISRWAGWQLRVTRFEEGKEPEILSQRAYADNNEALELFWAKVKELLNEVL